MDLTADTGRLFCASTGGSAAVCYRLCVGMVNHHCGLHFLLESCTKCFAVIKKQKRTNKWIMPNTKHPWFASSGRVVKEALSLFGNVEYLKKGVWKDAGETSPPTVRHRESLRQRRYVLPPRVAATAATLGNVHLYSHIPQSGYVRVVQRDFRNPVGVVEDLRRRCPG